MASAKRALPTCASTREYVCYVVHVWSAEDALTSGERVIKDDDVRVVVQGASDVDALLLSPTQVDTLLSDLRASRRSAQTLSMCTNSGRTSVKSPSASTCKSGKRQESSITFQYYAWRQLSPPDITGRRGNTYPILIEGLAEENVLPLDQRSQQHCQCSTPQTKTNTYQGRVLDPRRLRAVRDTPAERDVSLDLPHLPDQALEQAGLLVRQINACTSYTIWELPCRCNIRIQS